MNDSIGIGITRAWNPGGDYTIAVVIPAAIRHALNIQKGDQFLVQIDHEGRIVYERIIEAGKIIPGKGKQAPTSTLLPKTPTPQGGDVR